MALWQRSHVYTGAPDDGEIPYETSSRMEPKRVHQWIIDNNDTELFPSKKQAIDTSHINRPQGLRFWEIPANHFSEQLFRNEANNHFAYNDIPSISIGHSMQVPQSSQTLNQVHHPPQTLNLVQPSQTLNLVQPSQTLSLVQTPHTLHTVQANHVLNSGTMSQSLNLIQTSQSLNSVHTSQPPSSIQVTQGLNLVNSPQILSGKDWFEGGSDGLGVSELISFSGNNDNLAVCIPKRKAEPKSSEKVVLNIFPSNVKSLLSTGLLEGIHVKYVNWARKRELRATIKDCGYLCGCPTCDFTKVLNAYELERHAGCSTKHPNNHIFLDNGKSIYAIVQELRSTPSHMLDEVIQSVIGSPVNVKRYQAWKESFQAANRALQRICGTGEASQLTQL